MAVKNAYPGVKGMLLVQIILTGSDIMKSGSKMQSYILPSGRRMSVVNVCPIFHVPLGIR